MAHWHILTRASFQDVVVRRTGPHLCTYIHLKFCGFSSTTRREHTSYCRISDDVEQILWEFGRSDPYNAVSYDTLHWDDGEKFGRIFGGLDHFTAATAIDFTEGNAFLALLECIVPCVVHLLPRNSPLVNALRALQQFRIMVGMDCTLESRLQIMDSFGYDYEKACRHYTCHAGSDIREKGATKNMSTRPGEVFSRRVTCHYNQTNGRDAEHQMVVIDGNEEAMARLDMIVADTEACENQKSEDTDDDVEDTVEPARSLTAHWRLSAPDNRMTSRRFETEMSRTAGGEAFNGFDMALQQFLSHHYPEQVITFEEIIMSMVDWAPQRDIMRCSPQFYGRPRYDCVLYNAESDPLSLARLVGLLPCTIPGNWTFDLAFVYRFKNSKWMPRTIWKGCRVTWGRDTRPTMPRRGGGDSRPTKTASGWGWGVNKDDGQEGPRADNGDERVGPGAGNGDERRTKMRPYGDPGDMGAGCSPDNGNERVGLRADKGDGRLGSRVKKRATSGWVCVPTKLTGGLSRVPTKTACIKRVGISPSTDKRSTARIMPSDGMFCHGIGGRLAAHPWVTMTNFCCAVLQRIKGTINFAL
ncbi:hypothetical protein B0H14DRAFT_2586999 [Mycena olivaceomarginata]|nr:hypothetical protein B0H14DRAFT_2586999 [Mycena olivaceomarginata]